MPQLGDIAEAIGIIRDILFHFLNSNRAIIIKFFRENREPLVFANGADRGMRPGRVRETVMTELMS